MKVAEFSLVYCILGFSRGRFFGVVMELQQEILDIILTNNQHNDIVVFVIPALVDIGAPWKVLPPGIHDASLEDIRSVFADNSRRKTLFKGLSRACKLLQYAGCSVLYLDGSYVTEKTAPGDFDLCWDPIGVDPKKLDPVFLDFKDKRANQKKKFGGECFPSSASADVFHNFIDYFQIDKETGLAKGIIRIHLLPRKARHRP